MATAGGGFPSVDIQFTKVDIAFEPTRDLAEQKCRFCCSKLLFAMDYGILRKPLENLSGGSVTDQAVMEVSYDLYDILDHADNDELAPIVDLLIGSPFSYLRHARAYLRHNPNHGSYRDQIADDIYRLGFWLTEGLTTLAGSMDREKHSYAELLTAACKQIGISSTNLGVAEREAMLINMFTKQHLLTAVPEARAALVSEAASAAGKAASGMLRTDAWLPFVGALVEISYLRGIMTLDGRLAAAPGAGTAVVPAMRCEPERAISIVDADGQHAFSLATIPQEHAEGWAFMVPDGRTISKLTPFIHALQPFFNAEQMLAGKHIYSSQVGLSWSDKVGGSSNRPSVKPAKSFVRSFITVAKRMPGTGSSTRSMQVDRRRMGSVGKIFLCS